MISELVLSHSICFNTFLPFRKQFVSWITYSINLPKVVRRRPEQIAWRLCLQRNWTQEWEQRHCSFHCCSDWIFLKLKDFSHAKSFLLFLLPLIPSSFVIVSFHLSLLLVSISCFLRTLWLLTHKVLLKQSIFATLFCSFYWKHDFGLLLFSYFSLLIFRFLDWRLFLYYHNLILSWYYRNIIEINREYWLTPRTSCLCNN